MKKIILILFASLFFVCCSKDDLTNKKYMNIGDNFGVQYPKDTTVYILQYDTLRLNPTLENLSNDGRTYSYEWKIFDGPESMLPSLISKNKNLNVGFDYAPGTYSLQFNIIDEKTGIKSVNLYSLVVDTKFGEGWLVASNKGGKGELSFISFDERLFYNVIEQHNDKTYNEAAVGVQSAVYQDLFTGEMSRILYFTNKGMRQFDAGTFEEIGDLNSMFFKMPKFSSVPIYDQDATFSNQFIIHNGSLIAANGASNGLAEMGTYSEGFSGNHYIINSSFGTNNSSRMLFYDNVQKQFLNVAYNAREFNVPTNLLDNGSIGKKMIAADYSSQSIGIYLGLMYDETSNSYQIQRFDFSNIANITSTNYSYKSTDFKTLSDVPDIETISGFSVSTRYLHAYYSSKNKIYKIDFTSGTVSLWYEFPSGSDIADLKMFKRTNRNYQFNSTNNLHNTVLLAAVNTDETGSVAYLQIDDIGNLDTSKDIKTITGFGKIQNIAYRSPR